MEIAGSFAGGCAAPGDFQTSIAEPKTKGRQTVRSLEIGAPPPKPAPSPDSAWFRLCRIGQCSYSVVRNWGVRHKHTPKPYFRAASGLVLPGLPFHCSIDGPYKRV